MLSLETELASARKDVVTDGYDMSVGEIASLYRSKELVINPGYQRFFRWDEGRKTKFIESILLGIPVPPIFVFQSADGIWELVDGLQRVSTLLEFMGELRSPAGILTPASSLEATTLLPSLTGKTWSGKQNALSPAQKLDLKRARIRVEILKRESDSTAKFELFQRLNTGGLPLTPQEVRSCTAMMINPAFHEWLTSLAAYPSFRTATALNPEAIERQDDVELVLRFLAFRSVKYRPGTDVHEYLDHATIELASMLALTAAEQLAFEKVFDLLSDALGGDAFHRWDGAHFAGKFLHSVYEVMVTGVAKNFTKLNAMTAKRRREFLVMKAKALWSEATFRKYSGAGVRGSTRLTNLLPFARTYLNP